MQNAKLIFETRKINGEDFFNKRKIHSLSFTCWHTIKLKLKKKKYFENLSSYKWEM